MDWIVTYTLLFFFLAGMAIHAFAAGAFVMEIVTDFLLFVVGPFTGSGGGAE